MEKIYQELYYHLFNQISDAIEQIELQNYGAAKNILLQAQQDSEEKYIDQED